MVKPRVAIVGLGIMGGGMASRLLAERFPLVVFNRTPEKTKRFAEAGALVAKSPSEASALADVTISMVADDAASRRLWTGPEGILDGARPGTLLIESSTLSVDWIRELAALAAKKNCEFLDAPVTGTKPHAATGELFFMVGGTAAGFKRAHEVLSALGKQVLHLGPNGSGALLKLINNFVCGVQAASFAEAMAVVNASGLDREQCVSVLSGSALASPLIKRMLSSMATNDFTPNFPLKLMTKDIGYAIKEGASCGVTLQTAVPALDVFKHAVSEGLGEQDFSAVVKSVNKD